MPEQPFDPASFVRDLNPSLRRTILEDMDDTHVNLLPQDLQSEARQLRQQMELRQARLLHGRMNFADEGKLFMH